MKILHTSDWHLGNTFHGNDRLDEHSAFFDWLLDTITDRQPDAMIVAGDVFDSPNPSAAAESLFYDFLTRATAVAPGMQIVIIAGNHDSAGRLEAPSPLLEMKRIFVRGLIKRDEDGDIDFSHYIIPLQGKASGEVEAVCYALPYLRSCDYPSGYSVSDGIRYYFENLRKAYRKSNYKGLPVIAAAHFYASGAEVSELEHSERLVIGGQDCVEPDVAGSEVSYMALGHIHKAQCVSPSLGIYYSGSVLPMSFSEKYYRHGINWVVVDAEGHSNMTRIEYSPLRSLISIPAKGAIPASEVLSEIANLPQRGKKDDGTTWPYLEIRVEEKQPEPSLMHFATEALADKAVRFCRMTRVSPSRPATSANAETNGGTVSIKSLSPLEMVKKVHQDRYGAPLSPSLEKLFAQAEEQAEKGNEEPSDAL